MAGVQADTIYINEWVTDRIRWFGWRYIFRLAFNLIACWFIGSCVFTAGVAMRMANDLPTVASLHEASLVGGSLVLGIRLMYLFVGKQLSVHEDHIETANSLRNTARLKLENIRGVCITRRKNVTRVDMLIDNGDLHVEYFLFGKISEQRREELMSFFDRFPPILDQTSAPPHDEP